MIGQLPLVQVLLGLGAVLGALLAFWGYRPRTTGRRVITVAAGALAGLRAGVFALAVAFFSAFHLTFLPAMSEMGMLAVGLGVLVFVGLAIAFLVTRTRAAGGRG